jgi:alkanesulfonate monooxygenase SsuD/methylene tetrahydromethanopterin reductase-like flavin-dependent oxidoreductase (luciferase family)
VDELIAFITARLDEDEASAKAVAFRSRFTAMGNSVQSPGGRGNPPMPIADVIDPETASHIARHDPARVLREVAAKRAILARYEDCLARMEDPDYSHVTARDQAREYEDFVLPNLATVWSNHPDYRQEWNL